MKRTTKPRFISKQTVWAWIMIISLFWITLITFIIYITLKHYQII